jgi:FMN phosphatase YigB (HAD superfamily)
MPTLDRFRARRPGPSAKAACFRAVFFDIGNTLAERGEGGLFVVRAGARETIDRLRAAGVEIAAITNVPAGWTRDDLEASPPAAAHAGGVRERRMVSRYRP